MKLGLITCNVSDVSMNDSCSEFKELRQVSDEYERQTRDLPVQSEFVDAVESPHKQSVASTQTDTNTQTEVPCPRCGYVKHYNSKCPAIIVKCNLCSITGHYARCCRHKAQTRKPQYKANLNQPVVDTDRDNVSFLGELVMGRELSPNVPADPNVLQPNPLVGRKLRPTVPVQPNVLQPKLPNAVHRYTRQKEVESKASSKFNFDRKHRANELPPLTLGEMRY